MTISAPELRKLQSELNRLRAENARLRSHHIKTNHRGKPVAMPRAPKWTTLIGVGKEIWRGIDADAYINAERNSWN